MLRSWHGRCPGGMGSGYGRFGALFEVFENLLDDDRVFDSGNELNNTTR